jgi:hypothetical protein
MFTELGPGPGGSILAREDATGETMPILPANAAAMRQAGTLSSGGKASVSLASPWSPAPAAPSKPGGVSLASPWTPGPAQTPPQQSSLPPALPSNVAAPGVPTQPGTRQREVAKLAQSFGGPKQGTAGSTGSPSLQPVRRPQGQPGGAQVPGVEYEMVRTPGRAAGYVPHSRVTAGISEGQQRELLNDNADISATRDEGLQAGYEAQKSILEARRDAAVEEAANKRIDADVAQMRANDIITRNKKVEEGLNKDWDSLTATKVDRDRVWKDKGWGAGLLSAVSIALGEFGAKLNGGQNGAMMMIERMIDRDIEAQQADLQTRREGLTRKQNHYDRNLRDEAVPDLEEARMLRWESVQKQLAEEAANEDLKMLAPKLLEASAMAGEKAMAAKAEILNARKLQETESYDRGSPGGMTVRETARSQLEGRRLKENSARAKDVGEIQKVTAGNAGDPDTVWVNGAPVGKASNAKELNAQLASVNGLKRIVGRMQELNTDGSSMFDSDEYKSHAIEAGYQYMDAIGSPVKSDSDAIAAFELIGGENIASMRPEHRNKMLQSVVQRAEGRIQDALQQRGIYTDTDQRVTEK